MCECVSVRVRMRVSVSASVRVRVRVCAYACECVRVCGITFDIVSHNHRSGRTHVTRDVET